MKILLTLGFLIVTTAIVFLSQYVMKSTIGQLNRRSTAFTREQFLGLILLLLIFVNHWLLTQKGFPVFIYLLLLGATVLTMLVNEITGAFAGFGIKETRLKINVLYTAVAFQQGVNQPSRFWITQFASFILFGSWISALIIFWIKPLGDPVSYLWIALLLFIAPQITNLINNFNSIIPTVASAYVDNDLRNASLSQQFSGIIYSVIYFIFPFYLLHSKFGDQIGWLPPYWVLVSIPLLLFIFSGIIPYFIGMHRFKYQSEFFRTWIQTWIQDYRSTFSFADESAKAEKQKQLIVNLDEELENRKSDNKIFAVLELLDKSPEKLNSGQDYTTQIYEILLKNRNNLTKWDSQLAFVNKLEDIRINVLNAADDTRLIAYLESCTEEVSKQAEKSARENNKIAGILTTAITAIIGFLFRTYQDELLKLLELLNPS